MGDILIFSFLLFLSAFFSASETAYFSLTQARVRMIMRDHASAGKIVEQLKREPQRLLITILIGNNIVNLFMASYATVVATEHFGSAALGIATGVTTFLILIFGEIFPKSFAYASNVKIALMVAWPLRVLHFVLYPLTSVLLALNTLMAKWAGHNPHAREHVTEDEIRTLSRLGVETGKINYREHAMIENIFRFDDITASEVMTPLYKTVVLSGAVPVDQIAYFVSHEGYSRYPVHDGRNDDNIIGYVHVNDIMKCLNSDDRDKPIESIVSPVMRVPDSQSIERTFRSMLREHTHIFLVHEESDPQNVIGLVTLEDVIEEILGEIHDESDVGRGEIVS